MSFEVNEFSLDECHVENMDMDLAEASSEDVLLSGTYFAQPLSYRTDVLDNGRKLVVIQYQLQNENGFNLQRVNLKVSFEKGYTAGGQLDKMFKMYKKLIDAVQPTSNQPLDVIATAMDVPVKISVNEAYLVPEGDAHPSDAHRRVTDEGTIWVIMPRQTDENEDELKGKRMHYLAKSLKPISLVQNVFAA